MKKDKKGAAIVVGMFLMIVVTITMYVLLGQIVPFSKTTSGLKNTSNSYYQAYAGIENSLLEIKKDSITLNTNPSFPSGDISNKSKITIRGSLLPPVGKGNSDNKNYSKISPGNPIQLELPVNLTNTNINNARLCFKVPDGLGDFNGNNDIIFWTLSSSDDTLNGTELIKGDDIKNSNIQCTASNGFIIGSKKGNNLSGVEDTFLSFYNSNCKTTVKCTLRLSVINPLKVGIGSGTQISHLDYQIRMGGIINLYHSIIESSGKSFGFKKDIEVQVPQTTLNQAFDFTVFQ
ncbi:MAG: hypothetical protein NWP80_02015 [Candidatus Gracilibacteria bacterium]|nr:hypothetical protein [Candidatus Gracilibacteria bacterium]